MAKYEKLEIDPTARELSRRRFLRNAGITAAAVPFLGTFGEVLTQSAAGATSPLGTKNPWPHYPTYRFAMVCHVTADPFFVATRNGANDMAALLGVRYTWTGSETDIIPDLLRVDERCDVYVAEESGHLAAFRAGAKLSLV